ncbi:MAG: hypothetical protein ACRETY_03755 [Steroidobacteraceae bacterium]
MNRIFIGVVLAAVLGACGKSEAPSQSPSAIAADVAAPAVAPPPAPMGDASLIDGYVPAFPHKVRSMRHDGSKHFVVIEYLDVDRDAAIAMLGESLNKDGFVVRGPKPRDGGTQYIYTHSDGRRLDAIFSDLSARKLVNSNARGIAMFSWVDPTAN